MPLSKLIDKIVVSSFFVITLFFILCALTLIVLAGIEFWKAIDVAGAVDLRSRFNSVLETIALLTIAVAALELGQTILEEEVLRQVNRQAQLSSPTRVRRFLSRFLLVMIVALSIEFLVAVFQLIHDNPALLPHASAIGIGAAALLIAWGVFVRLNVNAEKLEPESMEKVKKEDEKLDD
jgi:hypothetical protein